MRQQRVAEPAARQDRSPSRTRPASAHRVVARRPTTTDGAWCVCSATQPIATIDLNQ